MLLILLVFGAALPAYLLGSVNGAIIASHLFYRKDIRKFGSGNPGLTNFYRVFGKGGVLLLILIDVIKTVAPVVFGGWLFWYFVPEMAVSESWLFKSFFELSLFGMATSGLFVVMGHSFPVFYGFKGGKGVMALGTIMFVFDWRLALITWGIFIVITLFTRFVSLGAIIGSAAIPFVQLYLLDLGGYWEFSAALLCSMLLIARHKGNIKRLIKGEESKLRFGKSRDVAQKIEARD